jgi:hypothetical protein
MKKLLFLFVFLIFNFSNSQNNLKNDEFRDWENPENFEKFGLKKVNSYSIKTNKKGKIKRDSLLLSEHNYDKSNSEIFGIFHYLQMSMHGGSHLEFYNFKNNYTKDGLLLKKASSVISKVIKNKNEHKFDTNFETFEYDSLKRKIKETSYVESNSISFYNKDTLSYFKSTYSPQITEYEYDLKNRVTRKFLTRDSTIYYSKFDNQKDFKKSKRCSSCEAKYLDQEWTYDDDKIIKYTNYTYKNAIHTKKFYYYNSSNQLIKQIDSTGYYYTKPYLSSYTEYGYDNNEKKIIKSYFDNGDNEFSKKEIVQYDSKNNINSIKNESNYLENNDETKYDYLDNSTIITRENKKHQTTFKEVYQFDKRGLLLEKKEYFNDILIELIKYYYE